jgi:hypothetical protein
MEAVPSLARIVAGLIKAQDQLRRMTDGARERSFPDKRA